MELHIESEKEFLYSLRYTLQNWDKKEERGGAHENCPINRINLHLWNYSPEVEVRCSKDCPRFLSYPSNNCPCTHFGSCKKAQRAAWEWIERKEKLYAEDR